MRRPVVSSRIVAARRRSSSRGRASRSAGTGSPYACSGGNGAGRGSVEPRAMDIELRDNQRDHRYEAIVDGTVAGFVQYQQRANAVVLIHTEVDPDEEGEGIGSAL